MNVVIESALTSRWPEISLGVIQCEGVGTAKETTALWNDLSVFAERLAHGIGSVEEIGLRPAIAATKNAYRAFGKDPSRYRGSAEALMRRVVQQKPLYRVNMIVDLNNYLSLLSECPVGSYDAGRIKGDVMFRLGRSGESYEGIGKGEVNLESLPIFADDNGPFGSPTSDSQKLMITEGTNEVLMIVISFGGLEQLMTDILAKARELIQTYAAPEKMHAWCV